MPELSVYQQKKNMHAPAKIVNVKYVTFVVHFSITKRLLHFTPGNVLLLTPPLCTLGAEVAT